MIFRVLESARLLVRPFSGGDAEALSALYSDVETMRFVGGVRSAAQVATELEHTIAGYDIHGFGARAVVLKAEQRVVGRCGLWLQQLQDEREVEVGYLVGRPDWGKGYATESARMVAEAGFAAGCPRLIAIIDPAIEASARVASKIGMSRHREAVHEGRHVHVYAKDASSQRAKR